MLLSTSRGPTSPGLRVSAWTLRVCPSGGVSSGPPGDQLPSRLKQKPHPVWRRCCPFGAGGELGPEWGGCLPRAAGLRLEPVPLACEPSLCCVPADPRACPLSACLPEPDLTLLSLAS